MTWREWLKGYRVRRCARNLHRYERARDLDTYEWFVLRPYTSDLLYARPVRCRDCQVIAMEMIHS